MLDVTKLEIEEAIDSDPYSEPRREYCERMEAEGYVIRKPEPNELLIDIDTDAQWDHFETYIMRLQDEMKRRNGSFPVIKSWPSVSGGIRRHVSVKIEGVELDNGLRIALQAALGSDPIREMLSVFRCWDGDPIPVLFAEKKEG